jgi:periplasmic divalent cation tolerance protein
LRFISPPRPVSNPCVKSAPRAALVLVTAPDLKTARALARAALEARLVACANLLPRIESHYWWRGKLERSAEILLLFKTSRTRLPALERLLLSLHPYDTPEFLVLPVRAGSARYLKWIEDSLQAP